MPSNYSTINTPDQYSHGEQQYINARHTNESSLIRRNWRAAVLGFIGLTVIAFFSPSRSAIKERYSTNITLVNGIQIEENYIQQPLMDELEAKLKGSIYFPWMKEFEQVRLTWNRAAPRPLAVIEVADESDVVEVVKFMDSHPKVELRVKGGGHNYAGYSVVGAGIVLSMKRMNNVEFVDFSKGVVRVGAGASMIDVLRRLSSTRWTVVTGICPTVGMAGFLQGGGMGYLSRKFGLGIDNVKSFKVVLASGEVISANDRSNSDLFWALKGGGGGNFGVVTEIDVQAHKGQDLQLFGIGSLPIQDLGDFFNQVSENKNKIPAEFFVYLEGGMGDPSLTVYLSWMADGPKSLAEGNRFFESFVKPELFRDHNLSVQYSEQSLTNFTAAQDPGENYYIGGFGGFLTTGNSTKDNWKVIGNRLGQLLRDEQFTLLDIELWGGAISKVSPTASAFPFRDALFNVAYIQAVPRSADYAIKRFKQAIGKGGQAYNDLKPFFHGSYVNYQMGSLSAEEALLTYYGTNLERLRRIKRRYDPTNRFRYEQSIPVGIE